MISIPSIIISGIFIGGLFGVLYIRSKREARLQNLTLHDKLMASTLKNPNDGPIYF